MTDSATLAATEETGELLHSLMRAKKNLRIYPENNPIYAKTLDDMHDRFTSVLETEGPLVLKIRQYDIVSGEDVIYHSEEKEDNLALLFFRDGVRELTFKAGIPKAEIEDFLKILSTDIHSESDEDIVTLMWERDFRFIEYVVDDTILLEDETYEKRAVAEAKEAAGGPEEIMKAYDEALGAERSAAVSIVPLTNDDVKRIIEEIENEPADKTKRLCQVLFEMLHAAEGRSEFDEIVSFMNSTLEHALSIGNLETAVYSVKRAREAVSRGVYPAEMGPALTGVESTVNSPAFLTPLGRALDSGTRFPHEVLREFWSLLNKAAIPHLVSLLGDLKNVSSRRVAAAILVELGKKDLAGVAKGLQDKRAVVVQSIIHILREIGDPVAVEYLTGTVRHSDKRVRREAIKALGEMGTAEHLPVLQECLRDADESIRIGAARAIGSIGSPQSRQLLSDFIRERSFRERSFAEKEEIFQVLARWREQETVNLILEILERGSLFKRRRNDETRAAAAHCAGLMGATEAADALRRLKKTKNRVLRDRVSKAMKRIDGGKSL